MAVSIQSEEKPGWQRPFFMMWSSQAVSLLGSTLVQFALVWWLTRTTGSAAVLASATVVALLPQIFLGPFVGAMVDRWSRRWVLIIADSSIAFTTLILVILFWTGLILPWHIYVAMLIRSLGNAFHWPAMEATTSLMVPNKHLARINGLNHAMEGLSQIVCPPLGALLMDLLPIYAVLSIDILTAAIAVIPLFFIVIPQPVRLDKVKTVTPGILWKDVKIGFRFVKAWPGLMALLLMATILNFLINPAFNLMPLMVTNHFHKDAWLLGALQAANGIGILLGGLSLGIWGGIKNRVVLALICAMIMGGFNIVIGFTPPTLYWIAIVGFFFVGIFNTFENASFFAAAQGKIPPEIQGRVFTLFSSLNIALNPLALPAAAFIVNRMGIMFLFKIAGAAGIVGMGITLMFRVVRNFEKDPVPPIPYDAVISDPQESVLETPTH
jgi:MFS transporter, DHA3 family, macrolide efflux protein